MSIRKDGSETTLDIKKPIEDGRKYVLDEFILSLKEKRFGKTDISDNIKTFLIAHAAMESMKTNCAVNICTEI